MNELKPRISQKQDFWHFTSLDWMNSIFSFNKYQKNVLFWLLHEKFSDCPQKLLCPTGYSPIPLQLVRLSGCSGGPNVSPLFYGRNSAFHPF